MTKTNILKICAIYKLVNEIVSFDVFVTTATHAAHFKNILLERIQFLRKLFKQIFTSEINSDVLLFFDFILYSFL